MRMRSDYVRMCMRLKTATPKREPGCCEKLHGFAWRLPQEDDPDGRREASLESSGHGFGHSVFPGNPRLRRLGLRKGPPPDIQNDGESRRAICIHLHRKKLVLPSRLRMRTFASMGNCEDEPRNMRTLCEDVTWEDKKNAQMRR